MFILCVWTVRLQVSNEIHSEIFYISITAKNHISSLLFYCNNPSHLLMFSTNHMTCFVPYFDISEWFSKMFIKLLAWLGIKFNVFHMACISILFVWFINVEYCNHVACMYFSYGIVSLMWVVNNVETKIMFS